MKIYFYTMGLTLLVSCSYNFDINKLNIESSPKVVVYCVICQDKEVVISLTWSKVDDGTNDFSYVDEADIYLYENNELVIHRQALNGKLETGFYPRTGKKYSLKIYVPDYGEISGETYIPLLPAGNISFLETRYKPSNQNYFHHFKLSGINTQQVCRGIWIYAKYFYQSSHDTHIPLYYYSSNANIDQVNVHINDYNIQYTGSNLECEGFIRLPYDYLKEVNDIRVSFNAFASSWWWVEDPVTGEGRQEQFMINDFFFDFICPSDEYDLYFRSIYKQYNLGNIPDTPFFNQNIPIQGNIKNGLGVFAGYSVYTVSYPDYPTYFQNNFGDHLD